MTQAFNLGLLANNVNSSGKLDGTTGLTTSVVANTIGSAASTALTLQSAGTTAITVDTSQNVGIGTTSPSAKLHVESSSVADLAEILKSTDAVNGRSVIYMASAKNSAGTQSNVSMEAQSVSAANADLVFRTSGSNVTAGTERMRIDSSGNVGVNKVPNNLAKLTVRSSANQFPQLFLEQNNTEDGWLYLADSTDGSNTFSRRQSGATSEKARFDINGNFMVGTTTVNSGKLNVVYTGSYGVYVGGAAGASTQMIFFSGATNTGSISSNGSNTAFNTSSDYRLKENIAPMTGCLAKVQALKPVTYKWKESGLESQGFIAHELAEVCPDAVTGAKDAVDENGNPIYQGIDTSFLVATLTAAIQELKEIIDAQATEIEALKTKVGI